ncbi:MAG: NAD(+)/NADH kinase [Phycisphaerales bacterium]|nr:NAD(+)/NADH kinase [Phycisphaerales bacterium]
MTTRPRVVIACDMSRPGAPEAVEAVRSTVRQHAELVAEVAAEAPALPSNIQFDLLVAVGGDGTLLSQCVRALDRQIPVVGVNNGRLGFLAEFDAAELRVHASRVFGADPLIRTRMALSVIVRSPTGEERFGGTAINDCVIAAGRPFRMIELRVFFDGEHGPDIAGDGVIVATPVGSTAYNVSAGGPIVHPDEEAMVVTPNAAHSLAFRPIVVRGQTCVAFEVARANEGTTLVLDGRAVAPLHASDRIEVRRHERKVRLIGNPDHTYWQTLLSKLRWAAPPDYRERGP